MWSPKTKPTPANIRKRIDSAVEALRAAQELADQHPGLGKKLGASTRNAIAWANDAHRKTR